MVPWLRLCASTMGGLGLIPGWGSSSWHVVQTKKKKKNAKTKNYAVLVSSVQQSDSVSYIYMYIHIHIHSFQILHWGRDKLGVFD